jgi:hypothetical protein
MGKVKHIVRSLRSRFTPTKQRNSELYLSPSPSPDRPPARPFPPRKLPSFDFETDTPISTPSKAPRMNDEHATRPFPPRKSPSFELDIGAPGSKSPEPKNEHAARPFPPRKLPVFDFEPTAPSKPLPVKNRNPVVPGTVPDVVAANRRIVSAQVDLAASAAMQDFAQRLPLEELGSIGHDLAPPASSSAQKSLPEPGMYPASMARRVTPQRTLWMPRCAGEGRRVLSMPARTGGLDSESSNSSALRVELEQLTQRSSQTELYTRSARTLSLTSTASSKSSWSFACRSARRVEREHAGPNDPNINSDESSFGSLEGWGVTTQNSNDDLILHHKHESYMSDEDFAALPDYSDVEDDEEYDERYVQDDDVSSVSSKASSEGDGGVAVERVHEEWNGSETDGWDESGQTMVVKEEGYGKREDGKRDDDGRYVID